MTFIMENVNAKSATATKNAAKFDWHDPIQFYWPVAVEAQHIDMFNHVNNAWYIAFAMDSAWAHSQYMGITMATYEELGRGFIVRKHREFEFYSPALAEETIVVGTWIKENDGKLRLTRGFEMRDSADGRLLVKGETQFVSIDMQTGRPKRMPKEFTEIYI